MAKDEIVVAPGKGGKVATSNKLPVPSLKRVWLSKPEPSGADVLDTPEFGGAPFALIVDYKPPKRGVYRVKLLVKVRDDESLASIKRHGLHTLPIYRHRAVDAVEDYKAGVGKTMSGRLASESVGYIWSPWFMIDCFKYLLGAIASEQTVNITFSTLMQGIELKGGFEEVRRAAREVTMQIDKIGAAIAAGHVFDVGETQIFAPGNRRAEKV